MANAGYRLEIDGLRAIAVLLVFIFHLDASAIPGGYIGVDIFYVISGFVIFRSVFHGLESGEFRAKEFYARRLRRLFPALSLLILLSFISGFFILTPKGYMEMINTALATVFSVSNLYFLDSSGYFSSAARNTPLLHTWSLGVEEQFYIALPLIIMAFGSSLKPEKLIKLMVLMIFLSFSCNFILVYLLDKQMSAFYLPFSRFWEIGVGGAVAFMEYKKIATLSCRYYFFMALAGLSGIFLSAFYLDEASVFPGFLALIPVLSVAMVIFATQQEGRFFQKALMSQPLVFLGKISYSLYLFHWPVIVFYGLYIGRDTFFTEKLGIFLFCIGLSVLSWRFVEQPFRKHSGGFSGRLTGIVLGILFALVIACSWAGYYTKGFDSRMSPAALKVSQMLDAEKLTEPLCKKTNKYGVLPKASICSYFAGEKYIDYIVWGDSHASMLAPAIASEMEAEGRSGILVNMPDCHPLIGVYTSKIKNRAECAALAKHISGLIRDQHVAVIIIASRWARLDSPVPSPGDGSLSKHLFDAENGGTSISFHQALARTVDRLRGAGAQVVIVGPVPEIGFDVPDMLTRAINWGLSMPVTGYDSFMLRQSVILQAMKEISNSGHATIVYPHDILCNQQRCMVAHESYALYSDDDHLSPLGAKMVAPAIVKSAYDILSK